MLQSLMSWCHSVQWLSATFNARQLKSSKQDNSSVSAALVEAPDA